VTLTEARPRRIAGAEARPRSETAVPMVDPALTTDDVTVMLRHLAQLRDSGVITEADFQTNKDELLSRVLARFAWTSHLGWRPGAPTARNQ
jgi:hypothetical protein